MNRWVGMALGLAALLVGGWAWGWKGVILGLSVLMFGLLLQFTQLMRVMRRAHESPLGHVDSAVMLQARLKPGMKLLDLLKLTHSLGVKCGEDRYRWTDAGGDAVEIQLHQGAVASWELQRAA